MAVQVSDLVRSAQEDAALRQALVSDPSKVAQERQLSVLVTRAASIALRKDPAQFGGVWY